MSPRFFLYASRLSERLGALSEAVVTGLGNAATGLTVKGTDKDLDSNR